MLLGTETITASDGRDEPVCRKTAARRLDDLPVVAHRPGAQRALTRNTSRGFDPVYPGERERHGCIRRHLASLGPGEAEGPFVQVLAQSD